MRGGVLKAVDEGGVDGQRGRDRRMEWSGERTVDLRVMAAGRKRWSVAVEDRVHQRPYWLRS